MNPAELNNRLIALLFVGACVIVFGLWVRAKLRSVPRYTKNVQVPPDVLTQPAGGQSETPYHTTVKQSYGADELAGEIRGAGAEGQRRKSHLEQAMGHVKFEHERRPTCQEFAESEWDQAYLNWYMDNIDHLPYPAPRDAKKLADKDVIDGYWEEK